MVSEEKFKRFILKELFSLIVLNVLFIGFPREYPYEIKLVLTTLVYWIYPRSIDAWIDKLKPSVYWFVCCLFVVVEVFAAFRLYGPSSL